MKNVLIVIGIVILGVALYTVFSPYEQCLRSSDSDMAPAICLKLSGG